MEFPQKYTPEQARRILDTVDELFPAEKSFWTGIIEQGLPEYYLERFLYMRDNYSDELPPHNVHKTIDLEIIEGRTNTTVHYKCQTNFLMMLGGTLKEAVAQGVLSDPNLVRQIIEFIEKEIEFIIGDDGNEDRMTEVNAVIKSVIEYLEGMSGLVADVRAF